MQALEVGHLGLVAGLDQRLEAVHHQLRGTATQHRLLTEQVSLGLLGERGLDAAGPQRPDGLGIRQGQGPRLAARVLFHRDDRRHAAPGFVLAAHQVPRPLGGDHADVDEVRRCDVAEPDVEPVGEEQGIAFLEVGFDRFGVQRPLRRVRHQHHDQIGLGSGRGRIDDPQSRSLGLGAALGALRKTHPHVDARVPQAQRMCVALRAIPQDGDHPVLDDGEV